MFPRSASWASDVTGSASPLTCPSSQPDITDARIFGVIGGTPQEPRVGYLKADAVVTPELMDQLGEVEPTQVFRFAGRCEEGRCAQFANGRCSLGERIAKFLPVVSETLPSCLIRATCRWHAESGPAACLRCPQVTTLVEESQNPLRRVAAPALPEHTSAR